MIEVPYEFRGFIPEGFQVKKARRPKKTTTPYWIYNKTRLFKRILGPACRRYKIAYLYWHYGWNAREVAEEMKMSLTAVKSVIWKIKDSL